MNEQDKVELERRANAEIDEFESWFTKQLGNSHLSLSERAAIKTFLYFQWVIRGANEKGANSSP